MNQSSGQRNPTRLLMNRTSLFGLLLGGSGLVAAVILLILDITSETDNPYLGILTFMVAPAITLVGLLLATVGAVRMRRHIRRQGASGLRSLPVVDLNRPAVFWVVIVSVAGGLLFLILSTVGTFQAYTYSESTAFCGETCHTVMEPEYTAYQSSPHANVPCTACHIGPGGEWFVKSKLNGLKQVWSTAFDTFSRPIETPIHNLRPARDTCYNCHWPEKHFGSALLERTYYRASEEGNDPWTLKMLVNVGGGDPRRGPGEGIHYHMLVENRIEYVAADEKRLIIPWIRQTTPEGKVIVYRTTDPGMSEKLKELDDPVLLAKEDVRLMDCIDCHNRPAHQYHSPERSMNESMRSGFISPTLPNIKALGCELLDGEYASKEEALAAIEQRLREEFPDPAPEVDGAIAQIQRLYTENFFPEMEVSWRGYPDHIGHMTSPGCFRCHDGKHVSDEGRVLSNDCNLCHTVIAQGPGTELKTISSGGLEFEHPEDVGDAYLEQRCDECHDGMPIL